jgi:GDP-mannose 6-dehydrogenase
VKTAVFGMGYVGCVTAAGLANAGHDVVGVDISPQKVSALNEGRSPVVEPGLADLIQSGISAGRLRATTDQVDAARNAEMILISVGTPTAADGSADLSYLQEVCQQIGKVLAEFGGPKTVMVRSTVPPGTLEKLVIPTIAAASGGRHGTDFTCLFCPEFLREASAIADFNNPPFTVIGAAEQEHAAAALELFAFLEAPLHVVEPATAESVKYASNAFHALKVSFTNEMARLFHSAGADPRKVMELFVQDRELNISARYLRPGFAYGGSCLPKDLRALANLADSRGVSAPLIDGIAQSNDAHVEAALQRVLNLGVDSVAQFGLTFKSATDDMRESPYVALAHRLVQAGVKLRIYDPVVEPDRLIGSNYSAILAAIPGFESMLCGTPAEALEDAQCVLVGSAHSDIYDAILSAAPRWIIDLRGSLPPTLEAELRGRQAPDGGALFAGIAW